MYLAAGAKYKMLLNYMKNKDSIFIKLLKKHTNIDEDFIDTFFKKFKIGGELDFDIEDTKVAKHLNIELQTLRNRLSNKYSKKIIL